MRCLVGVDDTDSSKGYCTTYLAYRIAVDLMPEVEVLAYPRLVRLNPNIPFKTRGNAAVCLKVEARDADAAFELISSKVAELSDTGGGANPAMVLLDDPSMAGTFEPLYLDALSGVVSPHRARAALARAGARVYEAGNGMGVVGAASALAFDERFDHTYELISYRKKGNWGTRRLVDSSSVKDMERRTFPHTFNSYDHQKRKVLICPHGPDPVFAGVRGDSPESVIAAFGLVLHDEPLDGHMVFVSNQHTDAHLGRELEWKAYSSGWLDGTVEKVEVGPGGHAYLAVQGEGWTRAAAAYEPTGDLRRAVAMLRKGDGVRVYGGVRRPTPRHGKILNLERVDVMHVEVPAGRVLAKGTYISSPRANRHLTKPLIRYGRRASASQPVADGWLSAAPRQQQVRAQSR